MTRIYGKLFKDGREGILAIRPSQPFFGVARDERFYQVKDGEIDIELMPTPPGVLYFVGYKEQGDIRKTPYTLKWRIPDTDSMDVTPGAEPEKKDSKAGGSLSVYEKVQLKAVANELEEALESNTNLTVSLDEANTRIAELTNNLNEIKRSTEIAMSTRDQQIQQLSEQQEPIIKTVYESVPVPSEPLQERIETLERENKRLTDLNAEYYKSVVKLHEIQLDKARETPQGASVSTDNSPQQRLLGKLFGR
tara:strand:- start:1708 stop:2457 length:750 start_codon:yes stop_codon:yes gene_type:complete